MYLNVFSYWHYLYNRFEKWTPHTHTHMYIYIYIYMFLSSFLWHSNLRGLFNPKAILVVLFNPYLDNKRIHILYCNCRNQENAQWMDGAIPKMWYTKQKFSPWEIVMMTKSTLEYPREIGNQEYIMIYILLPIRCSKNKQSDRIGFGI